MRRVLFLFLDGVGLGPDDPSVNPLVAGYYPALMELTQGAPLSQSTGRISTSKADLIPLDARMGVAGRPQSATGQAALLTGRNAPALVGEHYGPRPNEPVRELLREGNLFLDSSTAGFRPYFANAYPQAYFDAVARGKRLLSAIPFAAQTANLDLLRESDLQTGTALSADYTNDGWREQLGYRHVPVHEPEEAGRLFWKLAQPYRFILHDHWLTDLLGHRQRLEDAAADLLVFDRFLAGLLSVSDLDDTLIVIASDHGNVEDCSHGKHTLNPALCLLVGNRDGLRLDPVACLSDVAPVVTDFLTCS